MMLFKIFRKELSRKKVSMIVIFIFIMLSSLLISSGSRMVLELNNALDALFRAAKVPHFVQMHSGYLDHQKLKDWSDENQIIDEMQIVEMISIDGSSLFLSENKESEENSIMDISFVKQNKSFDFLLDKENRIIQLPKGEIGIPIYYAQQKNIQFGDFIKVGTGDKEQEFRVTEIIRDAQMNPAIVHSKRFLLNDRDFETMRTLFPETEYLIEFRLTDEDNLERFTNDYLSQGMPQKGPTVDHRLFKVLNGLSDGIVAMIINLLSLLLILIAVLCLRFTVITAIEEDYREIAVMKALGMPQRKIKQIYLFKYMAVGGAATISGYLISLSTNRFLMANSMDYLGKAASGVLSVVIPLMAVSSIFLFLISSVILILRRFKTISAIQAFQAEEKMERSWKIKTWTLKNSGAMNINLFMGIRDVFVRFKNYGLLTLIYFIASFITILPVNFLSTISSTGFISYMGIGRSDIRIDLHQTENIKERFKYMIDFLKQDSEIDLVSPLITSQFSMIKENGESEHLTIETGDFTLFPLDYIEGREPQNNREIALSYLNSQDLNKAMGDILILEVEGKKQEMVVCGVYQDITNGGHTAKASIPYNRDKVLWYTLSLDMKPGISIEEKVGEYAKLFTPARVTDLDTYISQTLGNMISKVRKITIITILIGLTIVTLITSLFLRMMICRDKDRIAIMRSLGFSLRHLHLQYLSTTLLLLLMGIIGGTIFTNTAGQAFISVLVSFIGVAHIQLIINPLYSSFLLPVLLTWAVAFTTVLSITGIKDYTIAAAVAE
ncbi:ABC transporter permease [Oceanispirochaeta crateris]|uniref:ABC transporter permease n=1 Tax=Oceanispirochaeta crateris TaxID=2518645 RepID=A0A5C1QI76_9SPIO|nr:ABC transporter permease [Oceanispirochaeta crateris]QEN06700.1 ABC transporter permease [Oceanispirochaeta crateris]